MKLGHVIDVKSLRGCFVAYRKRKDRHVVSKVAMPSRQILQSFKMYWIWLEPYRAHRRAGNLQRKASIVELLVSVVCIQIIDSVASIRSYVYVCESATRQSFLEERCHSKLFLKSNYFFSWPQTKGKRGPVLKKMTYLKIGEVLVRVSPTRGLYPLYEGPNTNSYFEVITLHSTFFSS